MKIEQTRGILFLCALFILHCILHLPFCIFENFGEPDACRLVIDAVVLAVEGEHSLTDYRIRSSPAYIVAIALLLKNDMATVQSITTWLTWLSLLSGGIVVSMSSLLVWHWIKSYRSVILFVALIESCPVFWQSSITGFPTLPALALFTISLALFDYSFSPETRQSRTSFALASILFTGAVLIKIDVLSLVPALLGLAYFHQNKKSIIWHSFAILVLAAIAFVAGAMIAGYCSAPQPATDFWQDWDSKWPMTFQTLFSIQAIGRLVSGAGLMMLPLGAIALGLMIRTDSKTRRLSLMLTLWMVPALIFWLSRPGGARHFLSIYIPLMITISWLTVRFPGWRRGLAMTSFVLLVNYFAFDSSPDTLRPSGRLVKSSQMFYDESNRRHEFGRKIATHLGDSNVVAHGLGEHTPYLLFEALKRSTERLPTRTSSLIAPSRVFLANRDFLIYQESGFISQLSISYRGLSKVETDRLEAQGVFLATSLK